MLLKRLPLSLVSGNRFTILKGCIKLKILVVDDNLDHRDLTRRALITHGHEVILAADGESGLQMAEDCKPDVILSDLGLPDLDGQTLVGLMRRIPELMHTPIIAVTAWPNDTLGEMVTDYGFDGCIPKPITVATFADQVATYVT